MKQYLAQLYLNPQHQHYILLFYLNRYKWFALCFVFLILISFPAIKYIYLEAKIKQEKQTLIEVEQKLVHKQQKVDLLQQKFKFQQNHNESLLEINSQLKQILDKHNAIFDNIQWNMEEKKIYLFISQKTRNIFSIINETNQLAQIQFQEIHLTKQPEKQHIQLNATLIFKTIGEE